MLVSLGRSSFALVKEEMELPNFGVSVDLNLSFVKAAKPNDELLFVGRAIKTGKRLAFLEGDILLREGNKLLVRGTHTKLLA
jgi:acyl-coenzyme A thioesterase PaaI-like protein